MKKIVSIHSWSVSIKIDSVGMKKKTENKIQGERETKKSKNFAYTLWKTLYLLKSTARLLSYLFFISLLCCCCSSSYVRTFPFLNFKFRRQFQCLIEILKGTMKQHYSLWKMDLPMHLFCRSMQCMRFIKLSFGGGFFFYFKPSKRNKNNNYFFFLYR